MRKASLAGLVVALALGTGVAGGGPPAFTVTFVSTTSALPPTRPYDVVNLAVELPQRKRDNVFRLVQAVTHCTDTDVMLQGGLAWVGTDGVAAPISGPYVGVTCRAWVYEAAGKRPNPASPASNVVSFTG